MPHGKLDSATKFVDHLTSGAPRLFRRRRVAVGMGILSLTVASLLTAVTPASASSACPGSVGINLVNTTQSPQINRGATVPGIYQVFSDPCIAQARATGLNNLANNQNTCIAFGTAATGAGGVASITSFLAGSAAATATTVFAPLVGVAGVFAIGTCVAVQGHLNSLANHIRGAAQVCGNYGIVYDLVTNPTANEVYAISDIRNMRCQNGRGGVGNTPPAIPGLDWSKSNDKVTWGGAPQRPNPAKVGGHENVCSGGVATGATHYVDVPSTTPGADWVYLSRKLVSRASNASTATYTVQTWNKNTGVYAATRTATYDCYKPDTASTVSWCALNQDLYFTPNGDRTWFKFLRREGTSQVTMEHRWSHVTGLYAPKGEFRVYCPTKNLVVTTAGTVSVNRPQNAVVTASIYTAPLNPVTVTIPNLPNDSTISFSGAPAPYRADADFGCTETKSGNPEIRSVRVYSSLPGYPKHFELPGIRHGSETSASGLPTLEPLTPELCTGSATWNYQLSYKWTQN